MNIRVTQESTGRRRGHLSTLTPGVALNFQDRYYLGATVNRTIGAIISTSETKRPEYHWKLDAEREQSALFLRLGAFAELTPELSIGLMYRPEFDWEFGETISKIYEDGELDTDRDTDHLELSMPSMWGIGAEYKVSPELVVALEIQSRPLSEFRWQGDEVGERPVVDNGFNFRVGAEYSGTAYPVRFGAFRDVIPFVDDNDTTPVDLLGITAGIGSSGAEDFSWNASVLFSRWEQVVNYDGQKYSEDLIVLVFLVPITSKHFECVGSIGERDFKPILNRKGELI